MGDSNESQATIWNATQDIQQDPPYLLYYFYVILAINVILAITACLGNTLILIALQKESSLHPPSKLLYRSLAFSDLFVGLILQPLYAIFLILFSNESDTLLAYVADVSSTVVTVVLCGASLFTITAISVDRLLALSLGLRYRQAVTLRRARAFVILSWIGNIAFGMTYFLAETIMLVVFSAIVLLCVAISSYCYIKIYLILKHQQTQVQDHLHQGQPNGNDAMNIARYRKTVSSAQYVYFTLLVCYIPFATVQAAALTSSGEESFKLWTALNLAIILVFLNSTLNPILYCWKMKEVRFAAKETVRQLCCCSSAN